MALLLVNSARYFSRSILFLCKNLRLLTPPSTKVKLLSNDSFWLSYVADYLHPSLRHLDR